MQPLNLNVLTDKQLHLSAIDLAQKEREITLKLLKHLVEIERRHLFSRFRCSSLHAYCMKELKFSDGQAGRRVSASRLLIDVPHIENGLISGNLSMSAVAQAGHFFNTEAKEGNLFDNAAKAAVCAEMENQSTRAVANLLISKSKTPEKHFRDKVKPKTKKVSEVRVHLNRETIAELDRLKEVWSSAMPGASYSKIIERMTKEAVERADPLKKAARGTKRDEKKAEAKDTSAPKSTHPEQEQLQMGEASASKAQAKSDPNGASQNYVRPSASTKLTPGQNTATDASLLKHASSTASQGSGVQAPKLTPAQIKRAVWLRDDGRCTATDEFSGDRCASRHFLEEDHVQPKAMGGDYSVENIRLRCKAHNLRHAIDTYGFKKMSPYFGATRTH